MDILQKEKYKISYQKRKEYYKQLYIKNKEKILIKQKIYFSKLEVKEKRKIYNNKLEIIEREKKWRLQYNIKTKEQRQEYEKIRYIKNQDKIKKYLKNYNKIPEIINNRNIRYKKYYYNNISYKIAVNMRNRMNLALKNNVKSGHTIELLGCSIDNFKQYLENQFDDEMSWCNNGKFGWHQDHIIPLSFFNLENMEEQKKAFHYTNYQPLWAFDNLSKGGINRCKNGI